jgi:hypothetical protein
MKRFGVKEINLQVSKFLGYDRKCPVCPRCLLMPLVPRVGAVMMEHPAMAAIIEI